MVSLVHVLSWNWMVEGQIRFFILLSSFSIFSPLVSVNEVYFNKEREFSFLEDSLTPNPDIAGYKDWTSHAFRAAVIEEGAVSWGPTGQCLVNDVWTSVLRRSISFSIELVWLALKCSLGLDSRCPNSVSISGSACSWVNKEELAGLSFLACVREGHSFPLLADRW